MAEDDSPAKVPLKITPRRKHSPPPKRPVKSSFALDHQFFVELLGHLEQARVKDNEQFRSWGTLSGGSRLTRLMLGTLQAGEMYPANTLPDIQQLADLVQTAFWSSLQREEGRALRFMVAFMQPEATGESILAFKEPIPYDERSLTKLAPALGRPGMAALVAPFEGGRLKFWGVVTHSYAALAVKVLDPGALIVKFVATNIAAVSGSEAVHIRDPLLTRSSTIWRRFASTEEGEEYSSWNDPRVDAVLEAVKTMRSLGHGGALIIVPEGGGWERSVKTPITYAGERLHTPFREQVRTAKDLKASDGNWAEKLFWDEMLKHEAGALAQFTSVDGATLVTYDLDVIGFGVKLQPAPGSAEPTRIFQIDPLDHDEWLTPVTLEKLGGTRHQSAARFVADQKDAVAFVVSQDGDVTAFAWEEAKASERRPALYAYRRLELTLF